MISLDRVPDIAQEPQRTGNLVASSLELLKDSDPQNSPAICGVDTRERDGEREFYSDICT